VPPVEAPAPSAAPSHFAEHGDLHFSWPVKGNVISEFGMRDGRMHDGLDIAGSAADPIAAAEAGEVIFAGAMKGYGKMIIIKHSSDFTSVYAHNQQNLVEEGDTVSKGQVVARMGQTGRASRVHLHFEIRKNRTPTNPLSYLPKT
jgi:murein DD-endopeptidase MepM/ murein hydrolase activator NlpD